MQGVAALLHRSDATGNGTGSPAQLKHCGGQGEQGLEEQRHRGPGARRHRTREGYSAGSLGSVTEAGTHREKHCSYGFNSCLGSYIGIQCRSGGQRSRPRGLSGECMNRLSASSPVSALQKHISLDCLVNSLKAQTLPEWLGKPLASSDLGQPSISVNGSKT